MIWRGTQRPVVVTARVDVPDHTNVDLVQVEVHDPARGIVRVVLVDLWKGEG